MRTIFVALCAVVSLVAEESASILLQEERLVLNRNEFPTTFPEVPPIESKELQIAPQPPSQKNPLVSAMLSSLIPGLGHVYINDMTTAAGFMGTTALTLVFTLSPTTMIANTSLTTLQATSFYSCYAAYRDTRLLHGSSNYHYPMPNNSLAELTTAPFSWSVMKKPEVWAGILGTLAVAGTTSYFAFRHSTKMQMDTSKSSRLPIMAWPVGIGEEALFRGFLQTALSERLNPTSGLILSSLAFGAAHIPNAKNIRPENQWRYYAFSLPLITGIGAYCGWLTQKHNSLRESVALHTWYDFVLFTLEAAAGSAAIGSPSFAFAIPF